MALGPKNKFASHVAPYLDRITKWVENGASQTEIAEKLHLASVETAKEAERGIVDIETLKQTNAQLIQTFDEVMRIQADGRAKRLAAESEMAKMENALKVKLLQLRNPQ